MTSDFEVSINVNKFDLYCLSNWTLLKVYTVFSNGVLCGNQDFKVDKNHFSLFGRIIAVNRRGTQTHVGLCLASKHCNVSLVSAGEYHPANKQKTVSL